MPWNAQLNLDYRRQNDRTLLRFEHDGPLRVLKSLYPEGDGVCHSVLVHPPGGLVAGDTLDVQVQVQPGAHALVSTPGATRFYRSDGEAATQRVKLQLRPGARLEWLPLETIAHPGCQARNHLTLDIAPDAELLGWEVTALGLPATGQAFNHGQLHQRIHWPAHWLEESRISGQDHRLQQAAMGLAGHRCLATMYLASGSPMPPARREALLHTVRDVIGQHSLAGSAAATCPNPHMLVVRALAPLIEPAMNLLQLLWGPLRQAAWQLQASPPRIWSV
ncbi:MAG: urease accessory protein UreD [Burkholderiaceae bacterium]|nr:urease accessory protein UreD [Burkholderiaceae bacterium]